MKFSRTTPDEFSGLQYSPSIL